MVQRALIGLTVIVALAGGSAWLLDASIDPDDNVIASPGEARARLAAVGSWGYQLQSLDLERASAAPHDLIVIDEAFDDSRPAGTLSRALTRLKRKPDGTRRLVLSYLSIGEAEDYRGYWRGAWSAPSVTAAPLVPIREGGNGMVTRASSPARFSDGRAGKPRLVPTAAAPAWLGPENADWRGNYSVRYWHPDWKALIYGSREAAIDRLIEAGFDGVYLDRADVYSVWRHEQPSAKADMVEFVADLATYARQKKPGFLVVMQNAEELLPNKRLRASLDGVAKEDLFYGLEGQGHTNALADVDASLRYLKLAHSDGLPVLVVEYLSDAETIASARKRIVEAGFVPYFGPRPLNRLDQAH